MRAGTGDVETHSLLASAYKDLWEYSSDQSSKSKYAELAIARYQEAYLTNSFDSLRLSQRQELETQYYPCINIAFMHFLSGDLEKGRENAEKARQICRKLKDREPRTIGFRLPRRKLFCFLAPSRRQHRLTPMRCLRGCRTFPNCEHPQASPSNCSRL